MNLTNIANMSGLVTPSPTMFVLIIIWSLFWKGLGLWHSAKSNQPWWFLALLLFNTVGILEIVYLFGFLKLKHHNLFPKF